MLQATQVGWGLNWEGDQVPNALEGHTVTQCPLVGRGVPHPHLPRLPCSQHGRGAAGDVLSKGWCPTDIIMVGVCVLV